MTVLQASGMPELHPRGHAPHRVRPQPAPYPPTQPAAAESIGLDSTLRPSPTGPSYQVRHPALSVHHWESGLLNSILGSHQTLSSHLMRTFRCIFEPLVTVG